MTTSLEKRRDLISSAPFYTLPPRKTSAQIIKEARQDISLKEGGGFLLAGAVTPRNGVRTVNTKRPFTPRCQERTLFGTPAALRGERPPSSFTLSPLNFDANEPSNRGVAAAPPLADIREGWLEDPTAAPTKLPALCRKGLFRRLSLGELPEERDGVQTRTPTSLGEGVVLLPDYQKGLQQTDLTICDLDASMEDASLRALLLPERPLRRLGPQLNPLKTTAFPPRERLETIGEQTFCSLPPEALLERRSPFEQDGPPRPPDPLWGDLDSHSLKSSRSGSLGSQEGGRGERSDAEQDALYEHKVAPVLDEISRAVQSDVSDGVLSELVDKLYRLLEAEQLLERHFRHRSAVLRTVFRLVDREHGQLLASLARVMLALRVSGNNLTSVTKLVFKVTRDDANDHLFMSGPLLGLLLEAVGRLSPLESPEAAVYGYGALKFLTMNSALCTRLLARGVLELLTLHMMIIVNEMEDKGKVPEQTCYAMVQLTATLRHVSSCERTFPKLLEAGTVVQVCRLLGAFKEDTDVTSNLARILSIVTTQPECCSAAAAHPATLEACVGLLAAHQHHPAIVVRLAYALGNMMATDDEARYRLFSVARFTDTLLSLLSSYLRLDREAQATSDQLSSTTATPEDVIIKLVRVLANVAVDPRVGPVLARSKTCQSLLISLVQHKSIAESEELVLSCFATLNNLTYYSRHDPPSALHAELANCLCDMVPMDHVEGLVEAIRVFGNLTHFREIRDILTRNQVVEVLVEMLDCDSRELVYVCCGVLVNIMSDASRRTIFQQENGVLRLVEVMQYFGCSDLQLCSLACQVLWNFCASAVDVHSALGSQETARLVAVLEALLEEGSQLASASDAAEDDGEGAALRKVWEDFAQVSTKLLDRIDNADALPLVRVHANR